MIFRRTKKNNHTSETMTFEQLDQVTKQYSKQNQQHDLVSFQLLVLHALAHFHNRDYMPPRTTLEALSFDGLTTYTLPSMSGEVFQRYTANGVNVDLKGNIIKIKGHRQSIQQFESTLQVLLPLSSRLYPASSQNDNVVEYNPYNQETENHPDPGYDALVIKPLTNEEDLSRFSNPTDPSFTQLLSNLTNEVRENNNRFSQTDQPLRNPSIDTLSTHSSRSGSFQASPPSSPRRRTSSDASTLAKRLLDLGQHKKKLEEKTTQLKNRIENAFWLRWWLSAQVKKIQGNIDHITQFLALTRQALENHNTAMPQKKFFHKEKSSLFSHSRALINAARHEARAVGKIQPTRIRTA